MIISSDIRFQCWSFITATPHNSLKVLETAFEREQISPNFIVLKRRNTVYLERII